MKTKTPEKSGYTPVAVQDGCFIGTENGKESIVVIVRFEKQGKKNILIQYNAKEFPTVDYLDKYITDNNLKVLSDDIFRAPSDAMVKAICKASAHN